VSLKVLPILALLMVVPNTENDPAHPPEEQSGVAFDSLECACADTLSNGIRCDALPAFGDNEWTHHNAKEFAAKAEDFAARVEAVSEEELPGRYYLALQGWADKREIRRPKTWSQTSPACRGKHDPLDSISNYDLAFLRACELRRVMRDSSARQIDLLPPVDYIDQKNRRDAHQTYSGSKYKAAVLFIVFPDRSVCGHANQQAKR
jgi:hypothetical protein